MSAINKLSWLWHLIVTYTVMQLGQYISALQDGGEGLSVSQATQFAAIYRIVDHHFDSTGLSA